MNQEQLQQYCNLLFEYCKLLELRDIMPVIDFEEKKWKLRAKIKELGGSNEQTNES